VGTSETLRSVIDAGRTGRRLDALSAARVIGKAAQRVHAAQQKAGAGKPVGPVTPTAIALATTGEVSLALPATSPLAYSAPEVVGGGAGDRKSDVFSLGVVMWEALTHARLFEATNEIAIKAEVGEREIKPPAEVNANVPPELSAICMRALARNPADRYQSAKAMAVEIEEFLEEAGYADSDDQIAQFLADLGKPKIEKKVTLPPPTLPSVLNAPTQPPSILKSNPQPPLASTSSPADAPTTAPGVGPSVLVAPASTVARTANGTAPPVPMPPVLPSNLEKIGSTQTVLGIGAVTPTPPPAAPAAMTAKDAVPVAEIKPALTPSQPVVTKDAIPVAEIKPALTPSRPVVTKDAIPVAEIKPALTPSRPVVTTTARAASQPKHTEEAAPTQPVGSTESRPNPAAVVALPPVRHSTGDVLAGWGWGSGAHEAITDDSELDLPNHGTNRKLLIYLFGGGLAFTLLVAIIAFGFGGSKKKKEPPRAAVTQEWTGSSATLGSAEVAAGPATRSAGSATTGSADSGSAAPTGSGALTGSTDTGSAAVGSAVAATGSVNPTPAPPPPPTTPPPPPPAAKVEAPKPPPKVVAKPEAPKPPPKAARTEAPKPPLKVARTETTRVAAKDVETAYRNGLQQFARGDTTGALASLRTSLAGNPNHAPTWRGLGLVFEKLGEKDQARAAFKRYLQLAPNAGDADQIHARLERLGS
jgi:serine/threonine-protein kinase